MDTEKKSEKSPEPTQDIGKIVGDLVVSGATILAHSAAEAVVKRVNKAAADSAPVQAVAKVVKKAKKSATGLKAAATKKGKAKVGTKKAQAKKASSKNIRIEKGRQEESCEKNW